MTTYKKTYFMSVKFNGGSNHLIHEFNERHDISPKDASEKMIELLVDEYNFLGPDDFCITQFNRVD